LLNPQSSPLPGLCTLLKTSLYTGFLLLDKHSGPRVEIILPCNRLQSIFSTRNLLSASPSGWGFPIDHGRYDLRPLQPRDCHSWFRPSPCSLHFSHTNDSPPRLAFGDASSPSNRLIITACSAKLCTMPKIRHSSAKKRRSADIFIDSTFVASCKEDSFARLWDYTVCRSEDRLQQCVGHA